MTLGMQGEIYKSYIEKHPNILCPDPNTKLFNFIAHYHCTATISV